MNIYGIQMYIAERRGRIGLLVLFVVHSFTYGKPPLYTRVASGMSVQRNWKCDLGNVS